MITPKQQLNNLRQEITKSLEKYGTCSIDADFNHQLDGSPDMYDNFIDFRSCLGYGASKKFTSINMPLLSSERINTIYQANKLPRDTRKQDVINYAIHLGLIAISKELNISFENSLTPRPPEPFNPLDGI